MQELASPKISPLGVAGEITPQISELLGRSHKMIKTILLPKATAPSQDAIDLRCREVLPRIALVEHCGFIRKCREHMNVIRHHDKFGELVSIAIEMAQALCHFFGKFRSTKHALTMTSIELIIPTI